MRNLLIALVFLFICTACPYESPVPISSKGDKMMESLLGKWQREEDAQNYYIVEKLDDRNYKIIENAFNEDEGTYDITIYTGFITEIKGTPFLNIKQYKVSSSSDDEIIITGRDSYYLYKLNVLDEKTFQLYPLSNYIREEFTKSQSLKKFVEQNMELSFFYGEEETFLRSTEE
ncbi:hypothetical protein [Chondrinema litorale]|uniref:hypothetical protein n=1 Tax=Chondrinema litorale TaxID=2994555 RepID=UPI002542CC30|nr:hypothetical protein [Chondrinema litorale]UZR94293.1 hypothetical protein OQ292_00490 [Chondrinema litorale]